MLNCVTLMGRMTVDPELKQTGSGVSVSSFKIAVERNFVTKGEDRQTDFITIVAWRQNADFVCRFFRKGQMIAIQGWLQTRDFEDKNGNKKTAYEVVAEHISFCGKEGKKTSEATESTEPADLSEVSDDDELPF